MRLRSIPQLPPSPPSPYVIRGTADVEIKPPPPPPPTRVIKDSSLTHETGQNIASIALSTASNFYQSNLWIFGAFNVPSPPLPSISFKHKVTCSVNSGYIASNASPAVKIIPIQFLPLQFIQQFSSQSFSDIQWRATRVSSRHLTSPWTRR